MSIGWSDGLWIFLVVWNGLLTFYIFRLLRHYNRLTQGTSELGLKEVLESLLAQKEKINEAQLELYKEVEKTKSLLRQSLSRVGLVRFNPFTDTGGNQSFSLSILDTDENGIVVTTLYGRNGNRIYVKHIKSGKGETELSEEEKRAVSEAAPLSGTPQ